MKNLYIIGGTMGVGKTTVSQILMKKLAASVFLDGDWCWMSSPFQVTDETREVVLNNITHMLNNFLRCSAYKNVIFCWVMHLQEVIDEIVSAIDGEEVKIYPISLIINEDSLGKRLRKDINLGIRQEDIIIRSTERIPLYDKLNTIKINVSDLNPSETAEKILNL